MNLRFVSIWAAGAGLALALGTAAAAAGPDFCRDYAHAAMDQVHRAMDHRRCAFHFDNGAEGGRWGSDWHAHYNWCLGVSRDQADSERDARRHALHECAEWH
jgi:hypothetical protein